MKIETIRLKNFKAFQETEDRDATIRQSIYYLSCADWNSSSQHRGISSGIRWCDVSF